MKANHVGEQLRRIDARKLKTRDPTTCPILLAESVMFAHGCAKSTKSKGPGSKSFPAEHLYQRLGLLRLEALTANLPWANA